MSAGPTVIVTGASSGIGRALARAWAKKGARVILSARGEAALKEVALDIESHGGSAVLAPGDVTREEDRARLIETAREQTGRLDLLVNNAGRGYYGSALRTDPAELPH